MKRLLRQHPTPVLSTLVILGLAFLLWPAREVHSENFLVYLPNAHHVLPVTVIKNSKYLPVLQVLNLVGKVNGLQEKKSSLKIWFGNNELELHDKDQKVRVDSTLIVLRDPVRIENGQWMVPVDFLISSLTPLTHQPVEFQMGSNRIFVGDVKPNSFTVRLDRLPSGARLTLQFADKVQVRTASSDGKWVMFLGDRPVEPLEQSFRFQDPYVSEIRFDDQDGVPKLIVTPTTSGLNFYPSVAEEGKILLADIVKPSPSVAEQAQPPPQPNPPAPSPAEPARTGQVAPASPVAPLPTIVLDAGHGGDDTGARSRDGVLEKDLVAQLAANVRLALVFTRKYRVVLTRVGDVNLPFEQRELATNLAQPAVFLTFHAGNMGAGTPRIAVYTYQPSSSRADRTGPESPLLFVPWRMAQTIHLSRSRELAQALEQQLGQIPGTTASNARRAPVRALRSVDAPAVAIEIGSLSRDTDAGILTSPDFQQQIAAAIVRALEAFQGSQPS